MNVGPDHLQVMIQSYVTGPGSMTGGFSLIKNNFIFSFFSNKAFDHEGERKGRLY